MTISKNQTGSWHKVKMNHSKIKFSLIVMNNPIKRVENIIFLGASAIFKTKKEHSQLTLTYTILCHTSGPSIVDGKTDLVRFIKSRYSKVRREHANILIPRPNLAVQQNTEGGSGQIR
jgi:hypothetical protein